MKIADLSNVLRIFRGTELNAEEVAALFKEAMLMTLARATDSDSNIKRCEIATVQRILKNATGEEFSESDIRVAAASEIYQTAPLEKYLARVSHKLAAGQRIEILKALADVIRSDTEINTPEIRFFNLVAQSLDLTPAQIMGLVPS